MTLRGRERILVADPPKGREAPGKLNWIRAGKYTFRVASLIVSVLILLVVGAPIVGAVTPYVSPQNEYGLGIDLQTLNPQLQQIFSSSSTIPGPHTIAIPAFNKWFLPASVALLLTLTVNGTTVYQTPKASLALAPFQSGELDLTMDIPSSVIAQMQGQRVGGGGQMTLQEGQFWTITVDLSQG